MVDKLGAVGSGDGGATLDHPYAHCVVTLWTLAGVVRVSLICSTAKSVGAL